MCFITSNHPYVNNITHSNQHTSPTTNHSAFSRLAKLLVDYRDLPSGNSKRESKRNRFYGEFTECSRKAIASKLRGWNWPSDAWEDAKDLAQQCAIILCQQEGRAAGPFASDKLPQAVLERYLSGTVWNGARQIARTHLRKLANRGFPAPLDAQGPDGEPPVQLVVKGLNIAMKIDAKEFLKKLTDKAKRDALTHAGTTPLQWVIAQAFEPMAKPDITKRTLQRKIRDIRSQIDKELNGLLL